jgi:hypothetical protein
MIRKAKEKDIPATTDVRVTSALELWYNDGRYDRRSFFPSRGKNGGFQGRGGRGVGGFRGRGRGYGRGRG